MTTLNETLERLGACPEAREWANSYTDIQTAWAACKRSDWMLWLLARTVVDGNGPRLRLMACDFAEAVLHLVPEGEDRPRKAIEVARRFANGEATNQELAIAWAAAGDAARDAARDAAGAAASAAAGDAAWTATWTAARTAAWDAARTTASATASATAWDAAWDAAGAAQSNIIRSYFPECPEIQL